VIIPDNDVAGFRHAVKVGDSLLRVKADVRIIDLPRGKDLTEWKEFGGTMEQLRQLEQGALDFARWRTQHESKESKEASRKVGLEAINANDLLRGEIKETKAVIEKLLWPGITIFAGRPKVGKSWFALQLAVAAATGNPFLGSFGTQQ
jgi:DNA primase